MAAIFVIATASLGMTTGVLPRWFNLLSYGFGGLLILTPIVEVALTVAFPIWVIALSILLLYHVARLADDEVPGFAARLHRCLDEGRPLAGVVASFGVQGFSGFVGLGLGEGIDGDPLARVHAA